MFCVILHRLDTFTLIQETLESGTSIIRSSGDIFSERLFAPGATLITFGAAAGAIIAGPPLQHASKVLQKF